ncbi:MAG: hypothetical protein EOP24_32330 [Hyphomicrobiales bacterium]|jgi:hypothetical protein|nr:MAG: hypothetical protein EOP24_32330 [Hyphomicrobiales bacterium]
MSSTPPSAHDVLQSPELMEQLAAVEHERWSHWQRYLHSKCEVGSDGSLRIPPNLAQRWTVQMGTSYGDLPDDQKESDRDQVRKYLPVIARALTSGASTALGESEAR